MHQSDSSPTQNAIPPTQNAIPPTQNAIPPTQNAIPPTQTLLNGACSNFRRDPPMLGAPPIDSICANCGKLYPDHRIQGPYGARRTSPIWKPSREAFIAAIAESRTWEEVCKKVGIVVAESGPDLKTLKLRCEEEGIPYALPKRSPNRPVLVENSTVSEIACKQHVIRNKLLPYACAVCGNAGRWMEKPISLHLDHINGSNTDHRIENLRFLCPNCHSQTPTYAGKRHKKRTRAEDGKWEDVAPQPKRRKTNENVNDKLDWPSDEQLLKDVKNSSMLAVAQLLGCTACAVKKRLKKKGLWEKLDEP